MTQEEEATIGEVAMMILDYSNARGGLNARGTLATAREILNPLFAKIAALEAENAELRDKAIEVAASLMDSWTNHRREAAAIRALANKDDPK